MVKNDEWLRLRDAAVQLDVHYMTAYRYVRSGDLPAEQRNGQWYVAAGDLAAFVQRRATTARPAGRPSSDAVAGEDPGSARRKVTALADRLAAGDQPGSWRIVDEAIDAGSDLGQINARLLTPALRHIGDEWAAQRLTVGDEHRASVAAMRLLSSLGARFTRPGRKRGTVVLSTVPGDRHGLPSAIVADLLRAEGFAVADLGADTPADDIVAMATAQDRLVAVGLCATTPLRRPAERNIHRLVASIRAATGAPVLLGGSAVTDEVAERIGPDHRSTDALDAVSWIVQRAGRSRRVVGPSQ